MHEVARAVSRVGLWLGGREQIAGSGLPVEEFAHPYPLLAMALLGVNDHVLKGSGWLPGWLTGKLSDLAGLFFFPLFLTAAADTLAYGAFRLSGRRGPDYSLRCRTLLIAVVLTAAIFAPLKLYAPWGSLYIQAMRALDVFGLFGHFAVVQDPTDLIALGMLPLAYVHGRAMVRRVPIGRLQVLRARIARDPEAAEALARSTTRDIQHLASRTTGTRAAWRGLASLLPRALAPHAPPALAGRAQSALDRYRASLETDAACGPHEAAP